MNKQFNFSNHIFVIAAILFFLSCAAVMSPPGGPKDITPPELIQTFPKDGTVNYKGSLIELQFSEYIDESSIDRAIHILPTLRTSPELIYKDKKILIALPDSLEKDQTYIVVINRNLSDENKVKLAQGIQVAFSTGDQIDEGSISGKTYHSKPSTVHLWKIQDEFDSLEFFNRIPDYAIDASDDGNYEFKFLSPGEYRIAAVDQVLSGSAIIPERMTYGLSWISVFDLKKQQKMNNINIRIPTHLGAIQMTNAEFVKGSWGRVTFSQEINEFSNKLLLSVINEDSSISKITVFNDPLDAMKLNFILGENSSDYVSVMTPGLVDHEKALIDSGIIRIKMDTTQDTSNITLLQPNSKYVLNIQDDHIIPLKVVFSSLVESSSNSFDLLDDTTLISFKTELESPLAINIYPDQNWKPRTEYVLKLDRRSLVPIYGKSMKDSLTSIKFKTSDYQGFGSLKINSIGERSDDFIAKLTKFEKEQTVFRTLVNSKGAFNMERLPEGDYSLMFFQDIDKNGKYTPGNISPYRPSEWFYNYPDTVKIRANWELELDTIIMDNTF